MVDVWCEEIPADLCLDVEMVDVSGWCAVETPFSVEVEMVDVGVEVEVEAEVEQQCSCFDLLDVEDVMEL